MGNLACMSTSIGNIFFSLLSCLFFGGSKAVRLIFSKLDLGSLVDPPVFILLVLSVSVFLLLI